MGFVYSADADADGGRRTRTRTLCIRRTLCRHVTIGTPTVIFLLFDCLLTVLTVYDKWYTVPIVKNNQNHWCTNRHSSTNSVLTVYQSSKTVKNSQTAKNDHWCTNRHMSTQSPPNTQSHRADVPFNCHRSGRHTR